jgi:2'-5' RNA ligase
MTLDDQPQLRELVASYQQALATTPGIDLIPPQWLHLTMQGIGFVDEIGRGELVALGNALTTELGTIKPPAVEFHSLTVRPEAIYLKAHPADALYPLRQRMHDAVAAVLGPTRFPEAEPERSKFNPHVSIGYVNQDQEAEPIAEALRSLTPRTISITFAKANLLEFHRDHHMYEWTSSMPIAIGGSLTGRPGKPSL